MTKENERKIDTKKTVKKKTSSNTKKTSSKSTTNKTAKASTKKAPIKKVETKKANTKKSANTNTRKKVERKKIDEKEILNSTVVETKNEVNFSDLDKGEPDLSKTIVLKITNELEEKNQNKEEVIEEKKIKEPKKTENARTILGVDLPNGNTLEEKKERKKFYLKDALIFALIIPIIDLFAMVFIDEYTCILFTNNTALNYIATLLVDFTIIFIVTYIIDYILGESSIKKSKK